MKGIQAIKLAGGALIVAVSVSAWAQGNDTGTAPATSQSSKQANHALEKKVRAALNHAKDIKPENIVIRARGGAVTLEGTVPDSSQVDKAAQVAQGVAGVTSVKNALTIKEVGQ
ncbi:MAG TPA: BON domain-containing protein [Paraburkholderia sp.]|jgi:osmotically-inducible protein OsmY|uniref:BON domain-containing protein n=1 Tax=Paraburkholderia sp. TaxID=1926495 RepID=UPI002B462C85|nr:BON domain-containing protein [Paraburkholderia sp.]HKR45402.1 BON domain-containing protein [Paraburkholderia sp.]